MPNKFLACGAVVVIAVAVAAALPTAGDVTVTGKLDAKEIGESSGLVASRRHADVLYTHNDHGSAPMIFAVRPSGALVRQFRVASKQTDWEDISTDDAGHLYVANTGNNDLKRTTVEVYRLTEPADLDAPALTKKGKPKKNGGETTLPVEHTWRLSFPDNKPFDCESLFVAGGHAYLVSKAARTGEQAAMYRFPLDDRATELALEKVTDLPVFRRATGAAISPDGRRLAIVADRELCLFDIVAGDPAAAGRVEPTRVPLPDKKIEGVAFVKDGVMMTAESREVYTYRTAPDVSPSPQQQPAQPGK